ncbi:CLUMA_CG017117, isoform A, partial [Clunio marinus]
LLTSCSASFEQPQIDNNTVEERSEWINDHKCPDPKIKFFLFTRENVDSQQLIYIDNTLVTSNLTSSFFNPQKPSKIIIHGFRSDMFLTPLIEMKTEYLRDDAYNVFYVDWSNLSMTLSYPSAVRSIEHVGNCTAELVNRLRDAGGSDTDIHVIGFSLGAQVANYVANNLKPHYILPRITGLDPALPLFVTSNKAHKLDASDAKFVDVFHCNGLMQGQIERTGHVDFYFNNGIYQPGCASKLVDISACSHHRCPEYFKESIQTTKGFYGWKCQSYFKYVLGLCSFDGNNLKIAGNDCDSKLRGVFLVKTNSESPYAIGRESLSSIDTRAKRRNDDMLSQELEAFNADLESGKFHDLRNSDKLKYLSLMKSLKQLGEVVQPKVFSISNNQVERFS